MQHFKKYIVAIGVFLLVTTYISVNNTPIAAAACDGAAKSLIFISPWTSAFKDCKDGSPVIANFSDFFGIISWLVETILKLASYIALGFVIWGGIKYIKSQGDPSAISAAKNTIVQALGGFVVALAASAIVQFVSGGF